MLRRYPLRKAANEGAPDVHPKDLAKEVGVIELLIKVGGPRMDDDRHGLVLYLSRVYVAQWPLLQHQPRPFDYFEEGSSKTTPSASAKAVSIVAEAWPGDRPF